MKRPHSFLYLFCFVYIAFSFLTYKSLPIANGEEYRLLRGKETLDHFLHGEFTEKMLQPVPNYFLYNLYPMVLVFLNPKFFYEWFHLLNLLFALAGFVVVYFLANSLKLRPVFKYLTLISLVLFPRFFGELGINPVDMPFMVFYLLGIFLILKFARQNSNHWSILLIGVIFGIAQGLRQIGLTLYLIMLISDFYDYFSENGFSLKTAQTLFKEKLLKYFLVFIISNFFMIITWPNFAINFFKSYLWYLSIGQNFYLWDFGLLFFGKFLENNQRPWFYLPFFQIITYPIYILLLTIPTFKFFKTQIKNKTYFILVTTLIINYALYLFLKPVLYDGIRHYLFLAPIFCLIAVKNFEITYTQLKNNSIKIALIVLVSINLICLSIFTIKEYPYHYAYFNPIAFAFGNPYKLFESDYANTKYREASEWIRDIYLKDENEYSHSDIKKMLKVYSCDNSYALDYFSHKKFLSVINKNAADIIVCDYRNLKQSGYTGEVIKTFYLNGHDILYIIRNETV